VKNDAPFLIHCLRRRRNSFWGKKNEFYLAKGTQREKRGDKFPKKMLELFIASAENSDCSPF